MKSLQTYIKESYESYSYRILSLDSNKKVIETVTSTNSFARKNGLFEKESDAYNEGMEYIKRLSSKWENDSYKGEKARVQGYKLEVCKNGEPISKYTTVSFQGKMNVTESLSQKEFDKRQKAVDEIENASDFYDLMKKWGWDKKYPYAVDGVGYFIYGDKDNLIKDILSARGDEHLEDDSEPSAICLDYERSWYEYIEDLNDALGDMKLKNGECVKDNY